MLIVHETVEAAVSRVVADLRRTLASAEREARIALGGGSTLAPVARALARALAEDVGVSPPGGARRLRVVVSDDFVDPAHGSNHAMLREAFAGLHAVTLQHTQEVETLIDGAGDAGLDHVVLGLGTDAHTAAIFTPEDIADQRPLLATTCPAGTPRRSLGLPVIARARHIVILATGAAKADAVAGIFRGSPASAGVLARSPQTEIHADADAARSLRSPR
ncbi:6-phosphogluconolactonase [Salinarimonas chemoclinalis]|uniref:6-phosphogluconolactonase n=1 Tax=Salinarimonas chemoclinalis TaxID=3241599 RepID=UPI0035569CCE